MCLGFQRCQLRDHRASRVRRQALSASSERQHRPRVSVVGGDHGLAGDHPGTKEIISGLSGGLSGGTERPLRLMLLAKVEQCHTCNGGQLCGSTAQATPVLDWLMAVEISTDDHERPLDGWEQFTWATVA